MNKKMKNSEKNKEKEYKDLINHLKCENLVYSLIYADYFSSLNTVISVSESGSNFMPIENWLVKMPEGLITDSYSIEGVITEMNNTLIKLAKHLGYVVEKDGFLIKTVE